MRRIACALRWYMSRRFIFLRLSLFFYHFQQLVAPPAAVPVQFPNAQLRWTQSFYSPEKLT